MNFHISHFPSSLPTRMSVKVQSVAYQSSVSLLNFNSHNRGKPHFLDSGKVLLRLANWQLEFPLKDRLQRILIDKWWKSERELRGRDAEMMRAKFKRERFKFSEENDRERERHVQRTESVLNTTDVACGPVRRAAAFAVCGSSRICLT